MNEKLQHVVDTLEAWADDQIAPKDKYAGICWNLAQLPWEVHNARGLVAEAAPSWPESSGSLDYPVPHPEMPPLLAYSIHSSESLWVGEYGAARRRLCQHIADWCRANPARAMYFLGEDWSCLTTKEPSASVSAPLISLHSASSAYLTRRGI